MRRKADVTRCKEFTVRAFEHGDFIWCEIDLTVGTAAFWVEGAETQGRTHGPPKGTVLIYQLIGSPYECRILILTLSYHRVWNFESIRQLR